MKKALIIANMLFASATVFGMEFRKADVEEATRRSNCSIIEDAQYRQALWESEQEYLLQQAIAESMKDADSKGKKEAGKDISDFWQDAIESDDEAINVAKALSISEADAKGKKEAEEQKENGQVEAMTQGPFAKSNFLTLSNVFQFITRNGWSLIENSKLFYGYLKFKSVCGEIKQIFFPDSSKEKFFKSNIKGHAKKFFKWIFGDTENQKDMNDFLQDQGTKIIHILPGEILSDFVHDKKSLENYDDAAIIFTNPGCYTKQTLDMLKNQDKYTFVQRDHDSSLNGLGSQCAILALNTDDPTKRKLQQLKVFVGNKKKAQIVIESEEDNLEGAVTLGEYMKSGGLNYDDDIVWEKIAELLKCRIDIFVSTPKVHTVQQVDTIHSYGSHDNVKRLYLNSTYIPEEKRSFGHYTELRVFNKDGSQVR